MDIMATCLEVAEAAYPQTFEGRTITPTSGKSFLDAILNKTQDTHDVIFWEHLGAAALRQGNWKLVRLGRKAQWELYDLSKDKTEANDLAGQHPTKVAELSALWEKMAHEQQVYPTPQTTK